MRILCWLLQGSTYAHRPHHLHLLMDLLATAKRGDYISLAAICRLTRDAMDLEAILLYRRGFIWHICGRAGGVVECGWVRLESGPEGLF